MIKSVYKLDKRIKDVLDIQSSARYDDSFIGEVCYFANSIWEFEDLESCTKGTLSEHIRDCYSSQGNYFTANEFKGDDYYGYFIPEKLLKPVEKKYRPFTLDEWIGQHTMGDAIHYRCKSQKIELRHMYVGYAYGIGTDIKNTTSGTLTLGDASYSLECLFEDYEIKVDGEWQPFGVLDE